MQEIRFCTNATWSLAQIQIAPVVVRKKLEGGFSRVLLPTPTVLMIITFLSVYNYPKFAHKNNKGSNLLIFGQAYMMLLEFIYVF
jgi:hypothetical protein